jgi:hypothetical protein
MNNWPQIEVRDAGAVSPTNKRRSMTEVLEGHRHIRPIRPVRVEAWLDLDEKPQLGDEHKWKRKLMMTTLGIAAIWSVGMLCVWRILGG